MAIEWGEWTRLAILILAVMSLGIWMARWFGKYEQWARGMEEFKEDTKKALAEIRADIKKLIAATPHVLAGTSPLRLTDLGEEVSQCVSAAALAE